MSLIDISQLTFCYEGGFNNIFEDVSFQIDTSWKLGFIGRNGRGKTTFLHLLQGWYEYTGKIASTVDFEYFPFAVADQSLPVADIAAGITGDIPLWQLKRELSLLGVGEDILFRPFATLSSGEQTKVLLAALFLKENSFLLIDEPTNHLDMAGRKLLSSYLHDKQGFILVSHDRTFLDSCVDHILSINKTNIEIQRGNFSSWYDNKQLKDDYEQAENARLKKDISRLQAAARKTSRWSSQVESTKFGEKNSGIKPDKGYIGHKSAKMMKRAKAIEARRDQAAEEKSALLKNIENAEELRLRPLPYHTEKLVELRNISVSYGAKTVCQKVGFAVEQGERIALSGRNGSGKSSILKLICGCDISFSGDFRRASNLVISYVPQDFSCLSGPLTDFIAAHGLDQTLFKSTLRKLDFSRAHFDQELQNFSEGQKKKVLLAKSLCEQAHLYIWDEPLNYIDVFSRMQLEQLLLNCAATFVFVEHDSAFVEAVATKKICL